MNRIERLGEEMNGFWLKIIAMIAMLIDHSAAILLPYDTPLYDICRSIGRLAFPIFCFLLVEGFLHTGNVKKYLVRLGIFALLSDIPFDLAFFHTPIYPEYQNIFFTLFIGLMVLVLLKLIEDKYEGGGLYPILGAAVVVGGCLLSVLLSTDYNYIGILMILSFYLFRYNKVLLTVALVMVNGMAESKLQILAVFAMIPILFYNGQRGPKFNKYIFYAFYPVHIFVLYLIKAYLI